MVNGLYDRDGLVWLLVADGMGSGLRHIGSADWITGQSAVEYSLHIKRQNARLWWNATFDVEYKYKYSLRILMRCECASPRPIGERDTSSQE
jgi:hypothetical protein